MDRSTAALRAATLPPRGRSSTTSAPPCLGELDGPIGGAVRRHDHLKPVPGVVELAGLSELGLDDRLLVVCRDDQRHPRRRLSGASVGLRSPTSPGERPQQRRIAEVGIDEQAHGRPEGDLQDDHPRSSPYSAMVCSATVSHEYGPAAASRADAARRSRSPRIAQQVLDRARQSAGVSRRHEPPHAVGGDLRRIPRRRSSRSPSRTQAPRRGRPTARPLGAGAPPGRRGESRPGARCRRRTGGRTARDPLPTPPPSAARPTRPRAAVRRSRAPRRRSSETPRARRPRPCMGGSARSRGPRASRLRPARREAAPHPAAG